MGAESLQREGRAAYDKGDFTKALECYNRAVGRGSPSTKLLDSVAATHYRLGALEAALAAAKKAIQIYREDATGYLRAGLVLIKMEKASTALEIYSYGLKSIKHVGIGFEKLKKAHDDLQEQLAPKKSIDPLTVLPRELAISVLEYLTFRQRIAVSRVSKGWKGFIKSEPTLWAHLDFAGARKKVRTSFISTAINVGRSKITAVTLNQLWDFDKSLAALIKHCPLESIALANTGFQGQNLVDALKKATKLKELAILAGTDITDTTLKQVLETCGSNLEVFRLSTTQKKTIFQFDLKVVQLSRLRSFELVTPDVAAPWLMLERLAAHPALQSLTLRLTDCKPGRYDPPTKAIDFSGCLNLTQLDLRIPLWSQRHMMLPSSLRILRLATNLSLRPDVDEDFFSEDFQSTELAGLRMSDAPSLEEVSLDLPGLKFHKAASQFEISSSSDQVRLSYLKSFSIKNAAVDGLFDAFELRDRLSQVQHLSITDCQTLKDEHVEALLPQCKKLETLDLSGTFITGIAVKAVVQSGHVKRLVANDCTKIARDAVDWARAKGLQLGMKITSSDKGGKKVRY